MVFNGSVVFVTLQYTRQPFAVFSRSGLGFLTPPTFDTRPPQKPQQLLVSQGEARLGAFPSVPCRINVLYILTPVAFSYIQYSSCADMQQRRPLNISLRTAVSHPIITARRSQHPAINPLVSRIFVSS